MSKLLEKYKNFLPKYLVAGVIIIVPLFPKFPLFSIPGTYVAVRFEDLLLLLLGIVTFIKIMSDKKRFFKDEITQAVAHEVANVQMGSGRGLGRVHILNLMRDLRHYQRGVILTACFMVAVALPAQDVAAPASVSSPVTWKDARRLGVFTLAAAMAMPVDRDGQRFMQRRWLQDSPVLSSTADVFNAYGSPGVFAGSAALYAAGWASGRLDLARLGMRAGEAIAVSGMLTGGVKGIAGRARPYASPGRPGDFRLMSGVHDGARQSFPSGHTTAAFAFAAAMDRELRRSHPKVARWAGPSLYAAAALTGLARMHSDNHWASDVIMGAGIGTVSGLMVARFHADRPRHWIDRRFLPRARR